MRLKLTCKSCRRDIEIEGESIPRKIECPNCHETLDIPSNILNVDAEIGGFKVIKHIGSGGMGCVYLANQLLVDRPVALKVLPPEMTKDEQKIEVFLKEIRLLAKLHHPNIVTAFEAGKADGNYYMAMSYVEGETLGERIERDGKVNEVEALRITLKVVDALNYAWDKHMLLHRDIKPDNIMIDALTQEPKLLDMGISKMLNDDTSETLTGDGFFVGTPHYVSPEQINSDKAIDFRSDMYSLGCSLYELVTGEVPYDAQSVMKIVSKHAFDPFPDPSKHNHGLHAGTVALLRKMMAKKAKDRFRSWEDLTRAIRKTLKQIVNDENPVQRQTSDRPRRKLGRLQATPEFGVARILIPIAVILLLGIAAAVYILSRNTSQPPHVDQTNEVDVQEVQP